jgi:SEC-C motif-containing protein
MAGKADDETGEVEFVARNKNNGKASRLHENSRFSRYQGRWVYMDGKFNE